MKITLINPPYGFGDLVGKSRSMKIVMNVIQPLGLGYIAALLEREGYEVRIEDSQCLGYDHRTLVDRVTKFHPDILGISATTPTFGSCLLTAQMLKEVYPMFL